MKLGSHDVEPTPFPGNADGYLPGNSGKPGDICGFFAPDAQVFQCTGCELQIQPVDQDRYTQAPLETAEHFRVPWGGVNRSLLETHEMWVCDPQTH